MMKIKILDVDGKCINSVYTYEEYVQRFPEPTAEYGHRDYFDIYSAKYKKEPQIYDTNVTALINSLGFRDWEEDSQGRFSFVWRDDQERKEIFDKLKQFI